MQDLKTLYWRDKNDRLPEECTIYEPLISKLHPLLDPDLTQEKRLAKHKLWYGEESLM